jgi:transposase InsO family protein
VANGSRLPILGTGYTHLQAPNINFLLVSILHTPSLVSNLISVRKFTTDNWCSIEFDPFDFSMKDLITKTPLPRSNSLGDLYPFTGFSKLHNNFALSTTVSSVDVWHQRLGHPSNASLSHLISKFYLSCTNKSSTPSVCEASHKGKHVRLPFSTSHNVTYFPFQLIHCDLWTSHVESFTGFKYYLIVVDDYSHYVWTFPLRLKSDATAMLCAFHQYTLTQFHLPIQSIQCDNGHEFDNHSLCSFTSSKRIVLRLSYPHTSAQNGKAERSIHTINDIMRTLLFQSHLKLCYWVDAMNTTVYLYNILPSHPLQLITPYENSVSSTTQLFPFAHIRMSLFSKFKCFNEE